MKPIIQLNPGEILLYEAHPNKALTLYVITTLILLLPLFCVMYFIEEILRPYRHLPPIPYLLTHDWPLLLVGFIIIVALACYWLFLALTKYWYFITNQRCIIFSGLLSVKKKSILFSSILNVSIRRSSVMFGVSGVAIAAPAMGTVLVGLTPESAEKISNLISEQMSNARKK